MSIFPFLLLFNWLLLFGNILSTLVQIFSDEKARILRFTINFIILRHHFWHFLLLLLNRFVVGKSSFRSNNLIFKHCRIVLNCKRFSNNKWVFPVINILIVNLNKTLALSIIHHVLESIILILCDFSSATS